MSQRPNNDTSSKSPLIGGSDDDDGIRPEGDETNELTEYSQRNDDHVSPPTNKREITGWCLYAWASEPFIVSAVGAYVPIILEQIARDNGVLPSDKISPCRGSDNQPVPYPPQDSNSEHISKSGGVPSACVLPIFNRRFYVDTSSYALYTFSLSVLVQAICVISMSGAADKGSYRKTLLIWFAVLGGVTTMMYWFIREDGYYMASFLAIIANSAYGCVNVCGNSFLSLLVNNSSKIRSLEDDPSIDKSRLHSTIGELSSKISGAGAASGYVAALLVQFGTMLILMWIHSNTKSTSVTGPLKCVIGLVGVWWLIFQPPIAVLLRARKSPDLDLCYLAKPVRALYSSNYRYWKDELTYRREVFNAYLLDGYRTLMDAFKQASQLRDITLYLIGWFILSDSLTTINSAAILFAKSELQMNTIQLSRISILAMISAVGGSVIIPGYLQPRFNIDVKTMLLWIIVWSAVIPLYGVLGFFFNVIGLHHAGEMYILAIWYGFSLGGIATISRSIYSMLIPPGSESVFFALFSITDKGSSVLGPLLVGMVIDYTHEIRECFWVLLALLMLSMPIFYYGVNVERGMKEATKLSKKEVHH